MKTAIFSAILGLACAQTPLFAAKANVAVPPQSISTAKLSFMNAWSRPGGPNSAAFVKISNRDTKDIHFIKATADISCDKVELHDHIQDQGVMRMRQVEQLSIEAGGHAELKRGGRHIMFFGLKKNLKPGDVFNVTLTAADDQSYTFPVSVQNMSYAGKTCSSCHSTS